jgi:hypothetical protein
VESNHVQEVERLQGKVEPTGDFEILAAALVRAGAQDGT